MDVIQTLLDICLITGATWVLWLLIGLSVASVAVIIERAFVFSRLKVDLEQLAAPVRQQIQQGKIADAIQTLREGNAVEARVALSGLEVHAKGADAVAEAMTAAKAIQRVRLERRLAFLGTLGNNAPFIGLFGTVIGIIKAFHDLSQNTSGGAKAVMAGISEALVATAMGLFVAIPAVVAFNYFQRRIRAVLAASDALAHLLLSDLRGSDER